MEIILITDKVIKMTRVTSIICNTNKIILQLKNKLYTTPSIDSIKIYYYYKNINIFMNNNYCINPKSIYEILYNINKDIEVRFDYWYILEDLSSTHKVNIQQLIIPKYCSKHINKETTKIVKLEYKEVR